MKYRFLRCLFCFLLIGCIFLNLLPQPVQAADPVTIGLVGLATLVPVALAWLGVTQNPAAPDAFNQVVADLTSHLNSSGMVVGDMIQIGLHPGSDPSKVVPMMQESFLNSCIDFLYAGDKPVLTAPAYNAAPDVYSSTHWKSASSHKYYGFIYGLDMGSRGTMDAALFWSNNKPSFSKGSYASLNRHFSHKIYNVTVVWPNGNTTSYGDCLSNGVTIYEKGVSDKGKANVNVATGVLPLPKSNPADVIVGTSRPVVGHDKDGNEIHFFPYAPGFTIGGTQEDAQAETEVDADSITKPDVKPEPEVKPGVMSDVLSALRTWLTDLISALKGMSLEVLTSWLIELGAAIKQSLIDVLSRPLDLILTAVKALAVPKVDYITAKVDALTSEFSFADSILKTIMVFRDKLSGLNGTPPKIYCDLSVATNGHNYGGKVLFLDMSWYAAYKSRGDAIIGGFLWACFIWKIFKKLPGIISGASDDVSFIETAAGKMEGKK